jgi:hypothetical protein
MIRHRERFQFAQNLSGLGRLCGSSMSNHQVLAGLDGCLVGYDAVFWYAYAVKTRAESTQTADEHCVLQTGDDPGHQRAPNQHRAYPGYSKERGAKQQAPESTPESALLPPILDAVPRIVVAHDVLVRVIILPHDRQLLHVEA